MRLVFTKMVQVSQLRDIRLKSDNIHLIELFSMYSKIRLVTKFILWFSINVLFAASVLGYGLGSFRDGMLC